MIWPEITWCHKLGWMLFGHLGFGLQNVLTSNQKRNGFVFTNKAGKYTKVSLCATKQIVQLIC